jgi:Flp pilus assembly protein TadD
MWGVRGSLRLLAAGTFLTTAGFGVAAAGAQGVSAGAVVQPLPGANGSAELRRYLADLAANPRSLTSLVGAGRAALRIGDGQAALGFFGRAHEISATDPRVAAGMGSALVLLEQPQPALRLFAEAVQLGAPVAEIARDRGLAYDMAGDPRRAQQDYTFVLQRGEDSETRRRLALSLAISGNREAALHMLDPLLRRHDRPSYRTRAFVLALTGDANGASQAVNSAMPGQGAAMAPFLSRLAGLNPAQKAMAVHFGRFPSDGRAVQMAQAVDTSAYPAAVALSSPGTARAAPASTVRRRAALAPPVDSEPRRRPERQAQARPTPPAASVASRPIEVAQADTRIAAAQPSRDLYIPPAMRQDAPVEPVVDAPKPVPAPEAEQPVQTAVPAFSDIAALVQALPSEEPEAAPRPAAPAPRTTRPAAATPTPARTASRTTTPAARGTTAAAAGRTGTAGTRTAAATRAAARPPANPSRHWVQLGTGQRAALGFTYGRIRQSALALLRNRPAHAATNGNSARLLVGPFATAAEARAFVNQLARERIDALVWTSPAGEAVERLPAR